MLISSPCPLSHVLAYHNEQTLGALEKSVETFASYTYPRFIHPSLTHMLQV